LQAIEGDRVTNATGGTFNIDDDKKRITGGVLHTSAGTPYAYRVCERDSYGLFRNPVDVPRESIIHYFDPQRFDAYRGISIFSSGGLNHGRDMKEIVGAEKVAVKTNSKIALFWKKVMGGVSSGSGVNLFGDSDAESDGTINTQEINDGLIAYGFPGEDLKAHQSDRPSAVWTGFLEFLIHDFAIGTDLPKSFVWSMAGLSGPAARMESAMAQRTFQKKQDALERKFLAPALGYFISNEIDAGRLPFHSEWFKFTFQRPAHVTIDVGRESAANLAEHARGLITGKKICEEQEQDIYEVITQKAREAQWAMREAKRFGVPIEAVQMMTPNGNLPSQQTVDGDAVDKIDKDDSETDNEDDSTSDKKPVTNSESTKNKPVSSPVKKPANVSGDADRVVVQRAQLEAYGVAVSAGVITPTVDDEEHWRKQIGLPPLPQAVRTAWKKEQDVRRPITLTQPGSAIQPAQPTGQPADE